MNCAWFNWLVVVCLVDVRGRSGPCRLMLALTVLYLRPLVVVHCMFSLLTVISATLR